MTNAVEDFLYGPRIGKRLTRKRFVKLLMRRGIRRNHANELAAKARGTKLSYAEYLRQLEGTRNLGTSSMCYPKKNFRIDWSVING